MDRLSKVGYIASKTLATTLYLAIKMERPLLIEGEPGCGKTELAKALSKALGTGLVRLQCYEGLDASHAIYEWDYPRQLLAIRMLEKRASIREIEEEIYSEKYLLKRPLLRAAMYDGPKPPVLLIDEVDRTDEEFEAFLLEFLAEFQITIPEIGSIKAEKKPIVILTSNKTREIGDGLRRRCLYLYITYPPRDVELKIVKTRVPLISDGLAGEVVEFVRAVRGVKGLLKKPGVSETIDWASALTSLGYKELTPEAVDSTISCIVKSHEDVSKLDIKSLLREVKRSVG